MRRLYYPDQYAYKWFPFTYFTMCMVAATGYRVSNHTSFAGIITLFLCSEVMDSPISRASRIEVIDVEDLPPSVDPPPLYRRWTRDALCPPQGSAVEIPLPDVPVQAPRCCLECMRMFRIHAMSCRYHARCVTLKFAYSECPDVFVLCNYGLT